MYAIYRADLNMSAKKMASQCGHAFKLLDRNLKSNPDLEEQYYADGMGTNVVLEARHEADIMRALRLAEEAGLPYVLIEDSGHIIPGTAFDGSPIITAIGLGPIAKNDARPITKRFSAS